MSTVTSQLLDTVTGSHALSSSVAARPTIGRRRETPPADAHTVPSETLPALIARAAAVPDREPLVQPLLMAGEILLVHGQPRTLKSWFVNQFAIALAIGAPVAGCFDTARARVGLIASNEDDERAYVQRCTGILAGLAWPSAPPATLRLLIGRGVSLDNKHWRHRLREEICAHGIALLILDPLRSLTAGVDQGPTEIRDVMLWLRLLMQETGVSVIAVHHDQKPQPGISDSRRRAHRASGGGLFSHVDGAISFETLSEGESLCVPDGFKHRPSPEAFRLRLTAAADVFQLLASASTGAAPEQLALHTKLLEALRETGGGSGRTLAKRLHVRREDIQAGLEDLLAQGLVDCADGPRRAKLWCVRS